MVKIWAVLCNLCLKNLWHIVYLNGQRGIGPFALPPARSQNVEIFMHGHKTGERQCAVMTAVLAELENVNQVIGRRPGQDLRLTVRTHASGRTPNDLGSGTRLMYLIVKT